MVVMFRVLVPAILNIHIKSGRLVEIKDLPLGQVFIYNFGFPCQLHSICFSTIIFTITRGWHNRPGVAAVPIASHTK
jgi:hypothetical protein